MTTTNTHARAVVIGNAIIDDVHLDRGTESHLGGAGFNVAVDLATLGVSVALVTGLATDIEGQTLTAALRVHGVAIVPQPAAPSTGRSATRLTGGDADFTFNPAARPMVDFSPEVVHALDRADAVVVTSYSFDDADQVRRLHSEWSRVSGLRVLDPNLRPSVVTDRVGVRRHLQLMFSSADLVKVSTDDLQLIDDRPAADAVAAILDSGPEAVVLTKGPAGAQVHTATGEVFEASAEPGPVVSTIGAGDAVVASVVAAALTAPVAPGGSSRGGVAVLDWSAVLADAMSAAAATCRHIGGQIPVREVGR